MPSRLPRPLRNTPPCLSLLLRACRRSSHLPPASPPGPRSSIRPRTAAAAAAPPARRAPPAAPAARPPAPAPPAPSPTRPRPGRGAAPPAQAATRCRRSGARPRQSRRRRAVAPAEPVPGAACGQLLVSPDDQARWRMPAGATPSLQLPGSPYPKGGCPWERRHKLTPFVLVSRLP
jgi:hypothetical protein